MDFRNQYNQYYRVKMNIFVYANRFVHGQNKINICSYLC